MGPQAFVRVALFVAAVVQCGAAAPHKIAFQHVIIDAAGPQDVWLKAAGDLNGDGRPDLIAGGRRSGGLIWYQYPAWDKGVIAAEGSFSTDGEIADVDIDGDNDLVVLTANQLLWYDNPHWNAHRLDDVVLHDIEVADLNGDGRPDVVGRNQGAFGTKRGDLLHIYFQESPSSWQHNTVKIPDGEGLLIADINGDKRPDVVIGRYWIRNPGAPDRDWTLHEYGKDWTYPHTFVAAGDVNGDGKTDIVLAPSERAGSHYRISWFEAPRDPAKAPWKEHVVEDAVEAVYHFIGTADFDKDGHLDVACAAMHQGKSPQIRVYRNAGRGSGWAKELVFQGSSHSMRIVDVDGNGLPDLYGANWVGNVVELWKNVSRPGSDLPPGRTLAAPKQGK